ncbi:MAG: tetratricopeptide repeat protein [Roseivirga sp.]|nr:tetratricopeptide repeat protein [Roseivirga sp.]
MKSLLTFIAQLAILLLPVSTSFAQNQTTVDSLLNVLETDITPKEQITTYVDLAYEYQIDDTAQMRVYTDRVLELAEKIGEEESIISIVDAMDIVGMAYSFKRLFAEAEAQFKEVLKKSEEFGYKRGEGAAYSRIGTTYLYRGYLDTAQTLFTKAIEIQKSIDDKNGLYYTYYNAGTLSAYIGNYDEALEYYRNSLEITIEMGDVATQVTLYNGIANIYGLLGRSLPALDYYHKALDILEEGLARSTPGTLNNIGNIYHGRHEYAKAISYYERSLKHYQALSDSTGIALSYRNIGNSTIYLGEIDKAIEYLEQAVALHKRLGDRIELATAFTGLGEAYTKANRNSEALKAYDESLTLNREIGDKSAIATSLTGIGFLHVKLGNINQAAQCAEEALPLADELGALSVLVLAYKLEAQVRDIQQDYKRAFDALARYKTFNDSIISNENTREITRMEADYEFQQERDSVAFEQQKVELEFEKEIERGKVVKRTATGGGLLILTILILLYRSYLIKQKNNKELTSKNEEITVLRETEKKMAEESLALKERELTNITMLSHEKNELLQQIGDQIAKIGNKVDDKIIPNLKEIKQTISSNISDKTWESFTYHFEQVHPKFFNKLKAKYDDLSQNDLRLCAYIKVGLNNKVIAQMGNVTHAAVKKNVNRLKKKLGIGPDDSLRDFIIEFA